MSSDEKIMEEEGEGPSHETPQAITITIMDPSALETTTLDSALVASVEAQSSSSRQADGSLLMVPREGSASISVARGAKDLLQTVTETHMGTEELPVISNINSSEDTSEQSTIQLVTKTSQGESIRLDEVEEIEELGEYASRYCLICNEEMQEEHIPVFKSQTTTSHRKLSVFLGGLVGQKLTSRKAHSDIICPKCFSLLNKLDLLEVEIRDTKDEIVSKYQESVAIHGGRARRKKPAAARKSDYVFPKIEPEDEDEQAIGMEMDETFEPHVEDLMEEEHDRREDRDSEDEEWEPEFKKTRVKREAPDADGIGPPKRKRGRPRKDAASKPKGMDKTSVDITKEDKELKILAEEFDDKNKIGNLEGGKNDPNEISDNKLSAPMNISCTEILGTPDSFNFDFETLQCFCGVRSSSKTEYVEHMLEHRQRCFKCPKCSCAYSTSAYLVRHQRLVHLVTEQSKSNPKDSIYLEEVPKNEDTVCKYCSENLKGDVFDHVKIHLYGENECPACAAGFYTSQSMEVHIGKEHPHLINCFSKFEESQREGYGRTEENISPLKICEICNKVLATSLRMAQHRYSEHPEHYPWICSDCDLAFPSSYDRDDHWCPKKRNSQTAEKTLNKTECSNSKIKNTKKLRKEQPEKKRKKSDSYTCPVCTMTLTSQKALRDHARSHERIGRFECNFCGVRIKTKASLRVHINEIHTHTEIHKCKSCSKIFFSVGRLAYHVKRHHTNRNTYANLCDLCGKAFPYPNELRQHLRSHRNERPYKCEQCTKTFLKKGDLTYHIRSHTGERPHKCPHCKSRFPRPNTLMSHIRQHHQENERVSTADAATTTTSTSKSRTMPVTITVDASTTTTRSKYRTPPISTMSSDMSITPTTVTVMSSNSTPSNNALQQQRQTVATMTSVGEGDTQPQGEGAMVPVLQGQLVEAVVDGQVTEMQPVQYVQVGGLTTAQTVQTVQAVPVEGMGYDGTACGPYQIVHLQILQ